MSNLLIMQIHKINNETYKINNKTYKENFKSIRKSRDFHLTRVSKELIPFSDVCYSYMLRVYGCMFCSILPV